MKTKTKIIVAGKIITSDAQDSILNNHAVEIYGGRITGIFPFNPDLVKDEEIYNFENLVMVPGFIQTHIHLCQTLFRGLADDLQLLDWLQFKIFPYENAHNKNSLRASARLGIYELLKSGTTTFMDMGTLRHQEVIFDELLNSGMRAFAGKCMMDKNDLLPEFSSSTKDELKNTYDLACEYHNKDEKIKYGFAPRFVLTSTEELLKETFQMMKDFEGSIYHTHSSENLNECGIVRDQFGCDNVEYFDKIGVLGKRTVLAHCVHVNDNEKELLSKRNVNVSHCPSSNLKLGSGFASVPEFIKRGINVSLGSDGAPCNNNLNIFNEMKLASLIQKPFHGADVMDAKTIFKMSNINGAKALSISDKTGSIEEGKYADLVLLDLEKYRNSLLKEDNIYSDIVYTAGPDSVRHVMIGGEWTLRDGAVNNMNESELLNNGKRELLSLLRRV
jgi:5-methylthioadenosine/S-adenosylhomocysteine deaminase